MVSATVKVAILALAICSVLPQYQASGVCSAKYPNARKDGQGSGNIAYTDESGWNPVATSSGAPDCTDTTDSINCGGATNAIDILPGTVEGNLNTFWNSQSWNQAGATPVSSTRTPLRARSNQPYTYVVSLDDTYKRAWIRPRGVTTGVMGGSLVPVPCYRSIQNCLTDRCVHG